MYTLCMYVCKWMDDLVFMVQNDVRWSRRLAATALWNTKLLTILCQHTMCFGMQKKTHKFSMQTTLNAHSDASTIDAFEVKVWNVWIHWSNVHTLVHFHFHQMLLICSIYCKTKTESFQLHCKEMNSPQRICMNIYYLIQNMEMVNYSRFKWNMYASIIIT